MAPETISSPASLREHYPPVVERAKLKTLRLLDMHCRSFIARSPFLCLGTAREDGADVTPRGDAPGFVHVLDDTTIAIPDWPGNNRLDSLTNITVNANVGILFLIPGVDETLRVNGTAVISLDAERRSAWNVNGKTPRSVLLVTVTEAFFHCGKALIRSRLWHDDYKIDRAELPQYGQILKDQINVAESAADIQKSINEGYACKLY
ncbi:MAG: pyridoxamine 5'-phosphate oxidase family protein [Acidobacteria bacterium]|nr:pyridoxamine 5'-phosphate oxidase family protein [Acidobacteriota bacterium]